MSNKNKAPLMPKLRFPEFQRLKGWESKTLGMVTIKSDKRNRGGKSYPVYSISNKTGFTPQSEQFEGVDSEKRGYDIALYKLIDPKTFAYNPARINVGSIGYSSDLNNVIISSLYVCFKAKSEAADQFLLHFFETSDFEKSVDNYVEGGIRSYLFYENFARIPIPLPLLPEQKKIADCLSSLDELIAAQARKVDALKTHKKGLMQQLFPREGETQPRLRFPEFAGTTDWAVEKLENLAKRGSGHTPSKSVPAYYAGDIKWVSLADSKRLDAGLISDSETKISELGIKHSSAVLHPACTVLISRDAGVGKSAVMAVPMAVSQHFIVWVCDEQKLSNWFLYYRLQLMKPIFERIATGSTIKTIGLPFFKDLSIQVPALPEQKRIADSLTSLDTLITAAAQGLDTLKTHKKGLMQQLFPQDASEANA